jgi:ligand-binding sensor domain-containing protein
MTKGIKILLFFYCTSYLSFAQTPNIKFEHITTEYGLANNEVSSIIQDSSGFIRFGTNKGLNRWDGYFVKYFGKSDTGGQALSSDTIHCMQLINGKLWLGTESGVNIFDPVTESFIYIQNNPKNKNSLSNNFITSICKDSYGNIWIGTADGLNEFNPATNKFKHFRNIPGDSNSLSKNFVSAIYQDSHKILWIGAGNYTIYEGGLNRFDYKSETFKVYYFHYEYTNLTNWILCFCQVKPNQLWIGTFGGIMVYDYSSESFIKYYCDNSKYENNLIFDIIEDKEGNVWIGSWHGGIRIFYKRKEQFVSYLNDPGNDNSLNEDRVMSIYEGKSKSILYTYDENNNQTGSLYQTWEDSAWVNDRKYSYTYNENKNPA